MPGTQPTLIEVTTRWPAFALPADSPLRATMIDAAHAFGVDTEPKIAGPSNIGNYLAGLCTPATAGFGVTYTGLHATDERFRTDTVPTVQAIYHAVLLQLLGHPGTDRPPTAHPRGSSSGSDRGSSSVC